MVPKSVSVTYIAKAHKADTFTGEPRSRTLRRRASRAAKIAMTSPSLCVVISLFRPWSPASPWEGICSDVAALLLTAAACCSTVSPARAKLVRVAIRGIKQCISNVATVIHHFACRSLGIGSWRRIGQSAMDLVIFYSPEKCCVTYYINNDSAGYKIEYPFSYIKNITLENGDPHSGAEGASQRPGGLIVELTRPPNFFMDSSGSGGFYQCGDFTEDQQASQIMIHHLGGHPKVLSGQLAKLIALESFQNRHQLYDPTALAVSAPVSPINHRPASQPNHHVGHQPLGMFHDTPFGVGVGLAPPRGHKRQRSRSVPVAIDFSMLRHPMPSFLMHEPPAPYVPHPDIVAPIPQYHNPGPSPMGPTLSIDTSAGYNMGFQQYHPMSATTAPSPSDFGTPAFFTTGPPQESIPASNMTTPYSVPFMSPMPDNNGSMGTSGQHMNDMGQHDPVIANQSPPLTSMGRSASADLYHMPQDGSVLDEGMFLGDMSQKQHMTLPFRAPMSDEQQQAEMDMNAMVSFGTIDPSSLGQQNNGM
jgi:hypothetical protein